MHGMRTRHMKGFLTGLAVAAIAIGSGVALAGGGYKGEHAMPGTVTQIDKGVGTVTVDSLVELRLHFPPPALEGIEKGDQVSVKLAIKKK